MAAGCDHDFFGAGPSNGPQAASAMMLPSELIEKFGFDPEHAEAMGIAFEHAQAELTPSDRADETN